MSVEAVEAIHGDRPLRGARMFAQGRGIRSFDFSQIGPMPLAAAIFRFVYNDQGLCPIVKNDPDGFDTVPPYRWN